MTIHIRIKKPSVPAAERSKMNHTRALARCDRGEHMISNTFRPGEQVCTICGLVIYCPICLDNAHLSYPQARQVYPLVCTIHQGKEG